MLFLTEFPSTRILIGSKKGSKNDVTINFSTRFQKARVRLTLKILPFSYYNILMNMINELF